jgi:hypothetical protein
MRVATRIIEVVLLGCFVFLLWSNLRLRSEVRGLRAAAKAAAAPSTRSFESGDAFAANDFVPCQGCGTQTWPSGRKIVAIVNPSCDSCEEVARNLTNAIPSLHIMPVVISTGDDAATTTFARKHGFGHFTFRISPAASRAKFAANPQVLIADDAFVIKRCRSIDDCVGRKN